MVRVAYSDIIQYRFASPFMTDDLIRGFQAGRNDETRQAHYLICHDYHVLSEAMLRCDCVGICTEPMLDYLSEHYELCRLDVDGRSEEHTSELQSLMRNSYAVFGLKKKKKKRIVHQNHNINTPHRTSS